MNTQQICYFMMGDYCEETNLPNWNITLPSNPKPKLREHQLPKADVPKLKVLHLSDFHYDPLYMEGSNANCVEPLCCRKQNGITNKSSDAAGKWGDYRCDIPKRTIEHLLEHIFKTHKVGEAFTLSMSVSPQLNLFRVIRI